MTNKTNVLIIVTSHAKMGGQDRQTGIWFEELTTPYYAFLDAGAAVAIASIAGGKVPVDPHSMEAKDRPTSVTRFLKDENAMRQIETSKSISELSVDEYDAVFLPGGHGVMWDMPENPLLSALLSKAWAQGKVVAAVCHGPAGFVGATDETGKPLVSGRKVAAFTNEEEEMAGLTKEVPFLLESRIRELGAKYESGLAFQPFAVRDGKLVTGQNPASSEKVAELVLEAVKTS